jgi:hypothetical protein
MTKLLQLSAIGFSLVCATSLQAQTPIVVPTAPSVAVVPQAATILAAPSARVLRAGLPILLKTSEPLTTKGKDLRVGQRVNLEVAENISLDGQIVIPAGSPATGELTDIRNKGMWGKSGKINGRVLFVRVDGRQIRLTGAFDDKGVTGTAGVVAAVAFIPIAGFFTTGTSAQIPIGAPVKAFLDEDLTLAPATVVAPMVAPQPNVVDVTAPMSGEGAPAAPK